MAASPRPANLPPIDPELRRGTMELSREVTNYGRLAMWSTAALLLSVPAFAMQFFPDAGVDWSLGDFVVMGVLLAIACGSVEVGLRMSRNLAYVTGVILAVGTGFVTIWANLAVGMIQGEANAANLVFLGVIFIALAGAVLARFQARGMAKATLAASIAQALVAAVVLLVPLDDSYTAGLIAAFALPWLLAAALFHVAADGRRLGAA
jgi:hypothetical protein